MPDPRQTTLPLDDPIPETAIVLLPDAAAEILPCICALLMQIVEDEQREKVRQGVVHEPT